MVSSNVSPLAVDERATSRLMTSAERRLAAISKVVRVRVELPPLMTQVAKLRVPLVVEVGVGANWDQAH